MHVMFLLFLIDFKGLDMNFDADTSFCFASFVPDTVPALAKYADTVFWLASFVPALSLLWRSVRQLVSADTSFCFASLVLALSPILYNVIMRLLKISWILFTHQVKPLEMVNRCWSF